MSWEPAHAAHSIEQVALTIGWQGAISQKPWRALMDRLDVSLPGLGLSTRTDLAASPFSVGLPVPGVMPVGLQFPQPFQARSFSRAEGGTLVETFIISPSQIAYQAHRYVRWRGFKERFSELGAELLQGVFNEADTTLIKLEYWDRFRSRADVGSAAYDQLFNRRSKYLPAFVNTARERLHSHVGFFVPGALEAGRRLINVNVDAVDMEEDGREVRSVGVYSMAQDAFDGGASLTFDRLKDHADEHHRYLKDVMVDILAPAMADRVSLQGSVAP